MRQWVRTTPLKIAYPFAGLLLALGAPVGFLLTRLACQSDAPSLQSIFLELRAHTDAYSALALSTAAVFVLLGRGLGVHQDRLRQEARTDPLTSLPNRRAADEHTQSLMDGRPELPLSLLLVDLDGLKQINTLYGHDGGDQALRAVGTALRKVCRKGDLCARYGGDEFVVILSNVVAEDSLRIGGRICDSLIKATSTGCIGTLSVSIGCTDVERTGAKTLRALVQSADSAMHAAKLEGKNRAYLAIQSTAASDNPVASPHV